MATKKTEGLTAPKNRTVTISTLSARHGTDTGAPVVVEPGEPINLDLDADDTEYRIQLGPKQGEAEGEAAE